MGTARPLARLERNERIEAETERVIELYRELDDADEVAARLGIKPGRVRRRMRDAGASIAVLRVERTAEVFQGTGTVEETAELLGVSIATVRKRLASAVVLRLIDELPVAPPRISRRTSTGAGRRPGRAPQRLHPELEAQTIALYEELRSLRKVGERLGITQEAVRLRLINAGVVLERHDLLTRVEQEQAVALYHQLRSVQAVAGHMGRAPLTIRKALERNGITVGRGGWHQAMREPRLQRKVGEARVMKTLYERLGSECAVAQMLGCSQTLVSNRLKLVGAAPGRGNHGYRPRRPELVRQVIELYEAGASARQAAFSVGVQPQTALTWLQRAGFDTSKAAMFARRKAA
jgi:predicted transcriptional regulator